VTALPIALLLGPAALAGWPEDVTLSAMAEQDGVRVLGSQREEYLELVQELGTIIANKPLIPARTLGSSGFDLGVSSTFAFVRAKLQQDGEPSVWERVEVDEDPSTYKFVPQVSLRKGFPFSTEAGLSVGWVGMSRQGILGGFGRVAVMEGYRPWPDLTLQLGYSGYVGNDELELGVLDMGVVLGQTYALGRRPGIRTGQFSPWLGYSVLRVSAAPTIDPDLADQMDLVAVSGRKNSENYEPAMILPQFAAGFQIANGTLLLRAGAAWVPRTIPTVSVGMGFTY
jgi:hypothetical protein